MKDAERKGGSAPPARTTTSRYWGGDATKLLGTLRGRGVLVGAAGEIAVAYSLDVYESRKQRSGSGTLDGDFRALTGEDAEREAVLRLADGGELPVALTNVEDDGAEFETKGAIPGY